MQLKLDKMQLKINQEKENPLLDRKEIQGIIEEEIAPSYKETRKFLSEKFSVSIDNIKINSIKGKFGTHKFILKANIYKTKEARNSTETKSKKEIVAEKLENIVPEKISENKEPIQKEVNEPVQEGVKKEVKEQ